MLMKNYKLVFMLILFLCFGNYNTYAKLENADSLNISNEKNKNVFDVYFFNYYGLGYQIFANDNSEIRIVLNLTLGNSKTEYDSKYIDISNNLREEEKSKSKYTSEYYTINISAQYLKIIYATELGKMYLGIGPYFEYYRMNLIHEEENNENFQDENQNIYGIQGLLGVRANISKSISLFTEIQVEVGKIFTSNHHGNQSLEIPSQDHRKTTNIGDGWHYSFSSGAIVGLRFAI